MKTVVVDKIASVAQHNNLSSKLRLSKEIPCEEGVLVAVQVLNSKSRYNQLELTSGRMATVNQGDVIVGALGHRKALRGYSGHLPTSLKPGDTIQILNIGGVLGICDSANPDVGAPFDCKVLGTVLHFPYLGERIGVPARAGANTLEAAPPIDTQGVPVVALAGTCMDSGKTAAACAIVSRLRHLGYNVAACKATGVSLRRDVLAMEDAGASESAIFSDFGIVTTTAANGPQLTRALTRLVSRERSARIRIGVSQAESRSRESRDPALTSTRLAPRVIGASARFCNRCSSTIRTIDCGPIVACSDCARAHTAVAESIRASR